MQSEGSRGAHVSENKDLTSTATSEKGSFLVFNWAHPPLLYE